MLKKVLLQVSGSFAQAKDALGEIASRLRARCLRDATVEAEPVPPRPLPGYGPIGDYPRGPLPSPLGMGRSGSYNAVKGGVHEPPSYSVHPSASRYTNPTGYGEPPYPTPNSSTDARYPNPNSSADARYSNPNSSADARYPNPNSSADDRYPNLNSSVEGRYPNPNSSVESHYPTPNSSFEARYLNPNSSVGDRYPYPNSAVGPVTGAERSVYGNTLEDPGVRMKPRDPYMGALNLWRKFEVALTTQALRQESTIVTVCKICPIKVLTQIQKDRVLTTARLHSNRHLRVLTKTIIKLLTNMNSQHSAYQSNPQQQSQGHPLTKEAMPKPDPQCLTLVISYERVATDGYAVWRKKKGHTRVPSWSVEVGVPNQSWNTLHQMLATD